MTLQDFYDKCAHHDWYYSYSDDHSVWKRGQAVGKELEIIATTSPEHKEIYDAWLAYVSSGSAFGTKRLPKPTRPEENT